MLTARIICFAVYMVSVLVPITLLAQARYQEAGGALGVATDGFALESGSIQRSRISLTVVDQTVEATVLEVARQAGLQVTYDSKMKVLARRISVSIEDLTVAEALNVVLKGTGVTARFSPHGKMIVLGAPLTTGQSEVKKNSEPKKEHGRVEGRVIDSTTKKGIGGVTVTIQGMNTSVVTKESGAFLIKNVPAGDWVVTAKAFGYKAVSRSVRVDDSSSFKVNFVLVAVANNLSEVVTTVTGEQKKLEIGNSIASINVDSVMKVAPVMSLTDLLENRVPGLVVQRSSGQPGDPSRIRLRGSSSVYNSNDPILVVDGVRVDGQEMKFGAAAQNSYLASSAFDQIDPNSIETVDVFKGPSAAAMYGSDAANGVIVITTKRGRPGPARWSGIATQGWSGIPGKYPERLHRFGRAFGLLTTDCHVTELACELDSLVSYQALNDPYYTIVGTGRVTSQSITASGGSEMFQYSATGSAGQNRGFVKMSNYLIDRYRSLYTSSIPSWMKYPDRYDTWNGQMKVAAQFNPEIRLEVTSSIRSSEQRKTALGSSAIARWSTKFRGDTSYSIDRSFEKMTREQMRYSNSARLTWNIAPWLPVDVVGGIDIGTIRDEAFLPRGVMAVAARGDSVGRYAFSRAATQIASVQANTRIPTWQERLVTSVGLNIVNDSRSGFKARLDELPVGVSKPSFGFINSSQEDVSQSMTGWFIEPQLKMASRFFVMPGFRLDNNGLSGSRSGLLGLPKMNLSWLISDEGFFPRTDLIDMLRLRIAFGTAGVQPGPRDRLRLFAVNSDDAGTNAAYRDGSSMTAIGNTMLQPERSTEFEGGFDIELWSGRLGLEITEYRKVRHDAIVDVMLAPSLSFHSGALNTYKANVGIIRNTGREVSMNVSVFESSSYGWSSRFTLMQNANRVLEVNTGEKDLALSQSDAAGRSSIRVIAGYPLWGMWARPLIGFHDVDGNNIITADEIVLADSSVYLGQPEPKGAMNMSNDWTFFSGRLGFHASMSYQYGMSQTASTGLGNPYISPAQSPDATLRQQAVAVSSELTAYSYTQEVNTFRLEIISVNLNLNPGIAQFFRVRTASVAFQGSNIWMRSNYFGKDPNVNAASNLPLGTVDNGTLSQPRVWTLRVTVGN